MVAYTIDAKAPAEEIWHFMQRPELRIAFGNVPPSLPAIKLDMQSRSRALALVRFPGGEPVGIVGVEFLNQVCVKLSCASIDSEETRGASALEVARDILDHLFKAGMIKVVAEIAAVNRPSLVMATALGFKREGVNRASLILGDQVVDQVYMGLTRSEWHGVRRKYGDSTA